MENSTLKKATYNAKVIQRVNITRDLLNDFYDTKNGNRYYIDDTDENVFLICDVIESEYSKKLSDIDEEFVRAFLEYVYTQRPDMEDYLKSYTDVSISDDNIKKEYDRIVNGSIGYSGYIHVDQFNVHYDCYKWGDQKDETNIIVVSTGYNHVNKRTYLLFSFGKNRSDMSDVEKMFMDATLDIMRPYKFSKATKKLKDNMFLSDRFIKVDYWFKMIKDINSAKVTSEKILNKINQLRDINGFHLVIVDLNNGFETQREK